MVDPLEKLFDPQRLSQFWTAVEQQTEKKEPDLLKPMDVLEKWEQILLFPLPQLPSYWLQ